MKVEIRIDSSISKSEINAVITCPEVTEAVLEAQRLLLGLGEDEAVITGMENGRTVIIERSELYAIKSENSRTQLVCKEKSFESPKPLKDFEGLRDFMRISKSCIVNLKKLKLVEPHYSGLMLLTLKNGSKEYISRKYLPDLKKYLGL